MIAGATQSLRVMATWIQPLRFGKLASAFLGVALAAIDIGALQERSGICRIDGDAHRQNSQAPGPDRS